MSLKSKQRVDFKLISRIGMRRSVKVKIFR